MKAPKFDLGGLLALHGESTTDEKGQKVEREFNEQVLEEQPHVRDASFPMGKEQLVAVGRIILLMVEHGREEGP